MFKGIPILMYHSVNTTSPGRNTVLANKFAQQLHYLHTSGYHTITLSELYNHFQQGTALPQKPVALTFDDGYEDNYIYVLPLLQKYGMKATVFPVAHWVGQHCGWKKNLGDDRLMSWEQLKAWQAAGMEIGAHTVQHVKLSSLTDQEVLAELTESKNILENGLGVPIEFLCYPYGDFDDRTKQFARQAGYKAALAIFNGASLFKQDLFALPRVGISARVPLWEFKWKLSQHNLFIAARIVESKIKNLWRQSK